jgi:hypothetical protein
MVPRADSKIPERIQHNRKHFRCELFFAEFSKFIARTVSALRQRGLSVAGTRTARAVKWLALADRSAPREAILKSR